MAGVAVSKKEKSVSEFREKWGSCRFYQSSKCREYIQLNEGSFRQFLV